jgi:DNA repair exonuclease SbcCD ATPase subunit
MNQAATSKPMQERVNDICNDLYSKGEKLSVRIVLAEMPDVSSTSTIHTYFKNWKQEVDANQQSLYDRLGFSPSFTKSFMEEITRFGVEAEQRYKDLAQTADEQCDHAIADLKKSEDRFYKQEAVVEQQEKQITELKTELADTKKGFEADLAKEQKANEVIVEELRQQLAAALDENKKLTTQNESIRTNLAKAELKSENNLERVNDIKAQNDQLVSDNKELNSNIANLNKDIAGKDSKIDGNKELINNLQSQQDKATKQLDDLSKANSKLQSEIESIRSELSAVNTKLSEEKDNSSKQITINSKLTTELEEQAKNHAKAINMHESTIANNEKLIAQLEKNQKK